MSPATRKFVIRIRAAADTVSPTAEAAESTTPKRETDATQASLRSAAFWLTRLTFADYERADFAELPSDAERELDSCVKTLRNYISQFPEEQSPPRAIFEAAAPVFVKVVKLIETYYPRPKPSSSKSLQ